MSTLNKGRHEIKYMINRGYLDYLKKNLEVCMHLDDNTHYEDNTYYIRSLYFDDYKNTAYYEKIDGISKREKFRIRLYNFNESYINLEKKIKDGDMVFKIQEKISKKDCLNIIDGKYDLLECNSELVSEFVSKCNLYNLKPTIVVDYTRLAYTFPVGNVRITIDDNIATARKNINLFDDFLDLYYILDKDYILLEVKYDDYFPDFLKCLLESIPSVRIPYSKYVLCREVDYEFIR